ncbi:MAG: FkbM family methyltransferase [Bacteroidetes bacterium]|nr:FkbM family methyltransferase [Bacteroidota bacterium]
MTTFTSKKRAYSRASRYFLEKQMDNAVKTNVEITTLSDVISAHQITQIDLLKIDVEGFEENVLQGIQPEHFGIIQYIIIEIETFRKGRKERIMKILEDNHFMIVKEDDDAHWGILFAQKIK